MTICFKFGTDGWYCVKKTRFVCLFSVFVGFFDQSSPLKRCSFFFVLFLSALILSSKDVFEEFVLNGRNASPLMKPLLTKSGWHEEKCVYVASL